MTSKWPTPISPEHRAQLEFEIEELIFSCDNPVEEAVMYHAGPRCDYYEELCASCKTWRAYDTMKAKADHVDSLITVMVDGFEDIDD